MVRGAEAAAVSAAVEFGEGADADVLSEVDVAGDGSYLSAVFEVADGVVCRVDRKCKEEGNIIVQFGGY